MPPTIAVHYCPWRLDSNLLPHMYWNSFTPFSVNVITDAICRLSDKCSAADLIPTNVLKWISDQIVPFIMSLFNCSLASGGSGWFPVSFKVVSVTRPKEVGAWSCWRWLLLTHLQLIRAVQTIGTPGSTPTAHLPVTCWPTSATLIWLPSRSFHRDCHFVCQLWQLRRSSPFGLPSSLCHLFPPFMIWEFLLPVTWWCAEMCAALCHTALPCCDSCTASVTLHQSSSHSSLPSRLR